MRRTITKLEQTITNLERTITKLEQTITKLEQTNSTKLVIVPSINSTDCSICVFRPKLVIVEYIFLNLMAKNVHKNKNKGITLIKKIIAPSVKEINEHTDITP